LQKASPEYTLFILGLSSPLRIGVYRDDTLIETQTSEKKISEVLLEMIVPLMERYTLSRIVYTQGPGSYMATKLTYITLKTIEIVKGIPLRGCSAFCCNDGRPIRAMGKLYFVQEGERVVTRRFDEPLPQEFALPVSLAQVAIREDATPDYHMPAV
jgi:hypothetical protein